MPNSRYNRVVAPVEPDIILPEQKVKYFDAPVVLPVLTLGNFTLQTTAQGAIESKPASAPANQEPADVVKPASLVLSPSTLNLVASAETSGAVQLSDLLNYLIDIPFSVGGIEMPIRSLFGSLFARVAGVEANVADISGVRLAAEEAKSALNDIHDAMVDVSGALIQLRVATAQSDLSGVLVRVAALESAPGFDATAINATIADLSGNVNYYKQTNDAAVGAAAADAASALTAAGAAQTAADAAASAASLAQSTADSKVAQSDYNAFVIATNSSLDSKALASDLVSGLASKADASALAAKEDKGLVSALSVEDVSVVGVNGAYWVEAIGGILAGHMMAGKIASFNFDAGISEITLAPASPVAGSVMRLRNAHASAVLPISLGGVSYEIVASETAVFQYSGSEWRLL